MYIYIINNCNNNTVKPQSRQFRPTTGYNFIQVVLYASGDQTAII